MTNNNKLIPDWRKTALVFHERAAEYDGWFEGNPVFEIELAALNKISIVLRKPKFEIGVGSGRFAQALDITLGIDPARAALDFAARRGVATCQGIGEALPVKNKSLGSIFMLFSLCFLRNPRQTLAECHRALQDKGCLVLGMVPASSAWGKALTVKKAKKHPFYRNASFYKVETVEKWLAEAGFKIIEIKSSLLQPPTGLTKMEQPREGRHGDAGFMVMVAGKKPGNG